MKKRNPFLKHDKATRAIFRELKVRESKVLDPLVRYSERNGPAYRTCPYCGGMFTHLGLSRHEAACPSRPR